MSTVVNARDVLLQAALYRGTNPANASILLAASTPAFHIAVGGANDPATITFTATPIGIEGTVVFAGVGCTLTTSGNVATLAYANLAGSTASVTASITANGATVTSNICTVTKIIDGAPGSNGTNGANGTNGTPGTNGTDGARGAGHFYVTGSAWSDATADAATPGANVLDDVVTISNGSTFVMEKKWSGSAWVAMGTVIDGSLIVPGSVTAAKINANGLSIRKSDGTLILDAGGGGLQAGFEAPGTKNNAVTIAANGALLNAGGGAVTIGGLGYTGDLNATLGANASNLQVGVGGRNMLPNSLPNSASGFTHGGDSGLARTTTYDGPGTGASNAYTLTKCGVYYTALAGTPAAGKTDDMYKNAGASRMSVTAGRRYEFSVTLSAHRCSAALLVAWYNSGGTYLGESAGSTVPTGGAIDRSILFASAPATAATAMVFVRMYLLVEAGPYVFTSEWYAGEALAAQTVPSPWSDFSADTSVTASTALATINDPTTGLAQRMRLNADEILGSVKTIDVVTAPSGFRAGNMVWTTGGAYVSGRGVAMTALGLIGYNNSGTLTFYINAANGNAYFGGELMAATGTFGAVTIAASGSLSSGMSAYLTGTGTWQGMVGGVYKASWGNSAGAYMAWNGSALVVNGATISGATISNPTLDVFTLGGSFDDTVSGANLSSGGTALGLSFSASPSGGKAPYKCAWTYTKISGANLALSSSDPVGTAFSVSAAAGNNQVITIKVTCTCTDANGRSLVQTGGGSITYGTA